MTNKGGHMTRKHLSTSRRITLIAVQAALLMAPLPVLAESPSRFEHDWTRLLDANGLPVSISTSASMPVFESRQGNPVLAPDGHQVTLAEFDNVRGTVAVKCIGQGTHSSLHMTGLIPNGVYTIWLSTYKAPGGPANLSAMGALGQDPDGKNNIMVADADGEGFLVAMNPAGTLTANGGTVGGCLATDEFQYRLEGAYHIDGTTYGKTPGPDGVWVEQFAFDFQQMNHLYTFAQDKDGNAISTDTPWQTLVFESRAGNQVVAPDGHQLNLAEFNMAQGTVAVKCGKSGTRTSVHMNGLVPYGMYTVWLVVFGAGGPAAGNIGVGVIGSDNGASQNLVQADKDGEAEFTAVNPGGVLSASGNIGACWTSSESEVHVVGIYHIDGSAHGSSPGPGGTFIEQFEFRFVNAN
jgi:hypothetical protein